MNDNRNFVAFTSHNDRNRYKSTFGENDIRFQLANKLVGLTKSFQYTEWISEILPTEITAKFTG